LRRTPSTVVVSVEYVRFADAGHVRSWNTHRAAYEEAVSDFLRGLLAQ